MTFCPLCDSSDAIYLGVLGYNNQFRCRSCGCTYMESSESTTESESNEDDFDDSMDGDHASALASAGFGTDEDYGDFGFGCHDY